MENVELIVAHGANGAEEVADGEEVAGGVEEEAVVGKKRAIGDQDPDGEPLGSWKKVSRPRMAPQAVAAVRWAAEPKEGMEREYDSFVAEGGGGVGDGEGEGGQWRGGGGEVHGGREEGAVVGLGERMRRRGREGRGWRQRQEVGI